MERKDRLQRVNYDPKIWESFEKFEQHWNQMFPRFFWKYHRNSNAWIIETVKNIVALGADFGLGTPAAILSK